MTKINDVLDKRQICFNCGSKYKAGKLVDALVGIGFSLPETSYPSANVRINFSEKKVSSYKSAPYDANEFSNCQIVESRSIVKLNDELDAEITGTRVKVGCQTFTHDAIRSLAEALPTVGDEDCDEGE